MTKQLTNNEPNNLGSETDKKFIESLEFILGSKTKAKTIHSFLRMPEEILPENDPVRGSIKKMVDQLMNAVITYGSAGSGIAIAVKQIKAKLTRTNVAHRYLKVCGWAVVGYNILLCGLMVKKLYDSNKILTEKSRKDGNMLLQDIEMVKSKVKLLLGKCDKNNYHKISYNELDRLNLEIDSLIKKGTIIMNHLKETANDLKWWSKFCGVSGVVTFTFGCGLALSGGGTAVIAWVMLTSIAVGALGSVAYYQAKKCFTEADKFKQMIDKLAELRRTVDSIKLTKTKMMKNIQKDDVRSWGRDSLLAYFDDSGLDKLSCFRHIINELDNLDLMDGEMILDVEKEDFMDSFPITSKIKKLHRTKVWKVIEKLQKLG